jgi:hypothetical protein
MYILEKTTGTTFIRQQLSLISIVKDVCERIGHSLTPDEWKQYFDDAQYRKTCEAAQQTHVNQH